MHNALREGVALLKNFVPCCRYEDGIEAAACDSGHCKRDEQDRGKAPMGKLRRV